MATLFFVVFLIKDAHNLHHSSCQNENISFAIYFYLYKGYIFEKENESAFNNATRKKRFWRKNYLTLFWQLKSKE